ncbi:TonB-dependent siderophore receptor [Duganella sp. BJB1802]|uniref:TonB-dependent siderophore receptor n=1 Tax=Duganella sp. BJB1802 TaxID=2744575 RepID=UPI001593BCF4|nr:TonB-dependent siderophore receptor [Duganella sp. BJB1802]NVD72378.1 TonB-dependent siderophore receptor [Duganella sp. BJB1802]
MRHQLNKQDLKPLARAVAGTMLLMGGYHMSAVASDAAPSETTLSTVVVQGEADGVAKRSSVGSKGDTPIVEVPQSISVLSRERLDAQKAPGIPQALRYTAGMQTESYGVDPRFDQYMIRGFEVGSNGIFRDGVNLPTRGFTGFTMEPYGLESVEVLRGPSSVLYGQAEVGGMVNVVSKRPTASRLREVEVSYGGFDRKQVAADIGGPLDEQGVWLYRATMLAREAKGSVDYTKDNRQYFAPSLSWHPDADTSLTLLAYLQNDNVPPNFYLPATGTQKPGLFGRIPVNRFVGEPGLDHFKTEQRSIGYVFEKRFSPAWKVRQNLRYATEKVDYHSLYMTGLHDDERTIDRANFSSQQKARVFAADQNVEWNSRFGGIDNTFVAGVDYSRAVQEGQNYLSVAPTLDVIAPVYGQPIGAADKYEDKRSTLSQTGVYAQNQMKFNGQYLLTAGLRRDRSRIDNDDYFNAAQNSQKDNATTGRLGLTWLAPHGVSPYLSYATSFRPVMGQTFDGRNFEPEKGKQVELGVKWAPVDRPALLTAALFDLRKSNVLTADPEHTGVGAQIQRGEVRVRGLELEAEAKLGRDWKVNGSLTGLDAKITRNNDGNEGKRPSLVPRVNVAAWAERTIGEGWRAGAGVRRIGKTFGDDANTFENPGVTLADAMFGYRHGHWDFALNVSNLTDKIYLGNCSTDGTCNYAARRQAQLTARYVW